MVLDENIIAFVVHIASLTPKMTIDSARKIQILLFITKKSTVPAKYLDFDDVFLKKLAEMLPKRAGIKKHAIKLEDSKQPPYGPIYSLGSVKLETLKTYIIKNLNNSFFWPLKFLACALFLFVQNLDNSLHLCVNYCRLNNRGYQSRYRTRYV